MENVNYNYTTAVRDNAILRKSFNELTQKVFGFDFEDWYQSGHWGDLYIPHVLVDGEKVVSNVSVNLIQFAVDGTQKNYIQIGTVMTDPEYRGQGLNREIMERILKEYAGKVDGIYLFGNDSVVNYYPKFGFKPSKEYEYYMPCSKRENLLSYTLEKVDLSDKDQCTRLYDFITSCADITPQNDALYMNENLGLYQFWFAADCGDSIYYLPEADAYVVADLQEQTLCINQIWGKARLDLARLVASFEGDITEAVFGFTPAQNENLLVREHKEEDCTLFIIGEDLKRIERDKMMFPILSHA